MSKRFYLQTEYNESEIRQLISDTVKDLLERTLLDLVPHISHSPPNCSPDKLIDRNTVCKLLQISLPTLAKLQKSGKLKAIVVGGSYRYSKKHIEDLMNGILKK